MVELYSVCLGFANTYQPFQNVLQGGNVFYGDVLVCLLPRLSDRFEDSADMYGSVSRFPGTRSLLFFLLWFVD